MRTVYQENISPMVPGSGEYGGWIAHWSPNRQLSSYVHLPL